MNVVKLCTLKPSEVLRLTTYLEKFAKNEDKKGFVLSHLGNFFIDLTLDQTVELSDYVSSGNEELIAKFIKKNPDLDVNLDGDSKIKEMPGWKVKEEALGAIYQLALATNKKTSKTKQIIRSRDLQCLVSIDAGDYNIELLKSKLVDVYSTAKFKLYIDRLKDIVPIKKFLAKVLTYYNKTHADYFVKYVFFHLDIVMLDKKHESELTKYYVSRIRTLVN